MIENSNNFGDRLKELLRQEGLTQIAFATKVGLQQSSVSYYVKGRVPEYGVLVKISEFFNVSIDWLLTGKETPHERPKPASIHEERETAELLKMYGQLPRSKQSLAREILRAMLAEEKKSKRAKEESGLDEIMAG